jgi:hypothetical protein
MIRLILTLLILAIPSSTFAAAPNGGQVIIGKEEILRGHFVEERNLKGFTKPMKSVGHFVVAPARGLLWGVEKPLATVTVITPAGLAQSINGDKVINLPVQKMPFMLHLYDMLGGALAGNWQAMEKDFSVVRSGDSQNWRVVLTPREADNPAMPFATITVSGSRFVEHVVLVKPHGDSDTITFLDQAIAPMPPSAAENAAFNSIHP